MAGTWVAPYPPEVRIRLMLDALELALDFKSVTEACARAGMTRSSFYRWLGELQMSQSGRRSRLRLPGRRRHQRIEPITSLERAVATQCRERPSWGCCRVTEALVQKGIRRSSATVHKVMTRLGLGTIEDRHARMPAATDWRSMPRAELAELYRVNPCLAEMGSRTKLNRASIAQGVFQLSPPRRRPVAWVHVAVMSGCCWAWAQVSWSRSGEEAGRFLSEVVAPFLPSARASRSVLFVPDNRIFRSQAYREHAVRFALRIERSAGSELWGQDGYVERVRRLILDQLVPDIPPEVWREDEIEELRQKLEEWLWLYNHFEDLPGYPNRGVQPARAASRIFGHRGVASKLPTDWEQEVLDLPDFERIMSLIEEA